MSVYYTGEAATLTISGGQYIPYFAVTNVTTSDIPALSTQYTVTYSIGSDADVQGTAPAAATVVAESSTTIPQNYTVYKEGYTLTGWSDGSTTYKIGGTLTPTADVTLTPAFTANTVSISDRTESVTAKWDVEPANGVPSVTYQGTTGIWVTQVTIGSETIDLLMEINATSGKFTTDRNSWAQVNGGTIFTVPVVTNSVITISPYKASQWASTLYGEDTGSTTYTYTGDDGNLAITVGTSDYMSDLTVTYPYTSEDGDESTTTEIDYNTTFTASWNFVTDIASGDVSIQSTTGTVASDVDGIVMTVDATNGKLQSRGGDAQFNNGTILQIPVNSTRDSVFVYCYSKYTSVTVGGQSLTSESVTYSDVTADLITYRATSTDVEQGYVEVVATDNGYLRGVAVKYVSAIQERALYSTTFTEWTDASAVTEESTVTWTTKSSKEELTFTIYNTKIGSSVAEYSNISSKFADWGTGYLCAAKSSETYVTTSALSSITKVHFQHGATGSNRGYQLEVKGDGDEDWVVVSSSVASTSSSGGGKYDDVTVEINRTNCQLRFTNLTTDQNAYLFALDIYGNVDISTLPSLGTFELNGTSYSAVDIFDDIDDSNAEATITIAEAKTMISSENPLTNITAENGELGEVTYTLAEDGESCVVAIPVTYSNSTKTYTLTVARKPKYTISYYDADGTTLIGTQIVEEDAEITEFAYGEANVTVASGSAFRGWAAATSGTGNRKYATDDVVTSDLTLYALVTEIEVESTTARYTFTLTDKYFYAEDHEAFVSTGSGYWYDSTHGWEFSSGDEINILVGGNAYLIFSVCKYSSSSSVITISDASGTLGTVSGYDSTDGATNSFYYEGEAGTLTLSISGGTTYIHSLVIANVVDTPIAKNEAGYYVVEAGNADNFLTTLAVANAVASSDERTYVFVPDGTYDLGETVLTSISSDNISVIGESMDNTIIVNTCPEEGISISATILNTASNTYMQDLTLQNAFDYYSVSTGRAVCLQDKGAQTICKNVRMLSYQDTYYSNAAEQFYFETSDIHGTVDFICGGGDVFFNGCTLTVEGRYKDGSGECTLTASSTNTSYNEFGYVFSGCTIDCNSASFNYGRAWNDSPRCAYINTTLLQPSCIISDRWTVKGMNVVADKFVEYNTMDSDGNVISPSSNTLTFTYGSNSNTMETILTADEAAAYDIDKVFTTWEPDVDATQVEAPKATVDNGVASWTAPSDAIAFLIYVDGELAEMVPATTTSYTLPDDATSFALRAANSMGGFGESVSVSLVDDTPVADIENNAVEVVSVEYYNLAGVRISQPQRGINLVRTVMSDGTTKVERLLSK